MIAERNRLDVLTTLRFFAATLVFLFHYAGHVTAGGPFWLQGFTKHGHTAVTFFFVLSGFILAYSYISLDGPSGLRGTQRSFWISRFARIYPLYLVALLIALPIYIYGTIKGRNPVEDSFFGILFVPLMLQAWIPPIAIEWSPPAWSLSVEAFFYVMFPFLARKTMHWNCRLLLAFSLLLTLVVAVIREQIWPTSKEGLPALNYNFRNLALFLPLFHLPSFLVGMALGAQFLKADKTVSPRDTIIFHASLMLLLAMFAARTKLPDILYSSPIMVVAFSLVIYFGARVVTLPGTILTYPLLVILGDASYAMYILQAPLSGWYDGFLKIFFKIHEWTYDVRLVFLYFLILVGASVASHKFVEKPCRRTIVEWFERRDKKLQKQPCCSAK